MNSENELGIEIGIFEDKLNREVKEVMGSGSIEYLIDVLKEQAEYDDAVEYGKMEYMDTYRFLDDKLSALVSAAIDTVLKEPEVTENLKLHAAFGGLSDDVLFLLYATAIAMIYQKTEVKHDADYNSDSERSFDDYVDSHQGFSIDEFFNKAIELYFEIKKSEIEEKHKRSQ